MSRSLKKGPYINVKLEKKVLAMNESGKKVVVKTWARASMISPDFVGDRKSTRLNSSHPSRYRMPSSA